MDRNFGHLKTSHPGLQDGKINQFHKSRANYLEQPKENPFSKIQL